MQKTIYNKDKLQDKDIDEIVTRVKVFIENNGNILLASSGGGCQLPGGHVEYKEDLKAAVIREIQEETGIVLDEKEIPQPFYEIRHYTKNHKETGLNRMSVIIYYYVKTDKIPNMCAINLTEQEKQNNFEINFVKWTDLADVVKKVQQTNPVVHYQIIAQEILTAFDYLNEYLKK